MARGNWTFIVWGGLNALYFLPLLLTKNNRQNLNNVASGRLFPNVLEVLKISTTFLLALIAWIFFRANNISHALLYLKGIFDVSLFSIPSILPTTILMLLSIFIIIEWIQREKDHGLEIFNEKKSKLETSTLVYLFLNYNMYF